MTTLADVGTTGYNLTVTGTPLFSQTGYVEEDLGIKYYNSGASTDAQRAGGSTYTSSTPGTTLLPDGGIGIEIIFNMPITPPVPSFKKGFLLFNIGGSGAFAANTINGMGLASIGICDANGSPSIGAPSGANAHKIFIAHTATPSTPTNFTQVTSSAIEYIGPASTYNDGLTHSIHLNLGFLASSISGNNLTITPEVFYDGVSLGGTPYLAPLVGTGGGPLSGRLSFTSISIGGFPLVSVGGASTFDSTASFPGIIEQVRIYDAPLIQAEIDAVITDYALPST